MSHEPIEVPPVVRMATPEVPPASADWTHAAEARLTPPTAEQARAADGVFAMRQDREPLADMIGLWASALVLHDVAVETFQQPEEERKKKRREPSLEEEP